MFTNYLHYCIMRPQAKGIQKGESPQHPPSYPRVLPPEVVPIQTENSPVRSA